MLEAVSLSTATSTDLGSWKSANVGVGVLENNTWSLFFPREIKTTCVTKEKHAIPWRISYLYLSRMEICELCSCLCPYANDSGVSLFVETTERKGLLWKMKTKRTSPPIGLVGVEVEWGGGETESKGHKFLEGAEKRQGFD